MPPKKVTVELQADPEERQFVEDFAQLFGDGTEEVRVELYRWAPEWYMGKKAKGFCEILAPGSDKQYIKDKWGGGTYTVVKRVKNVFNTQKYIEILGSPNPDSLIGAEVEAKPATPAGVSGASGLPLVSVDGEGIPVGVDDKEFFKQVRQTIILKGLLADQNNSQNDLLLKIAMRAIEAPPPPQTNMVDMINAGVQIYDRFREMQGGAEGGTDLSGMIGKAMELFGKFLDTQKNRPPAIMPAAQLPLAEVARVPVATRLIPETTNPGKEVAPVATDFSSSMVQQAIYLLTSSYSMNLPPAQVVELLQLHIPIEGEYMQIIREKKTAFYNMCLLDMQDYFDNENRAALVEAFQTWFNEVFDNFTKQPEVEEIKKDGKHAENQ